MDAQMARRLAQARIERGYSQEALAAQLGVSRQAVSRWECAESSPDTDNLIALARLYGMSIDALLMGEEADRAARSAGGRAGQDGGQPDGRPEPVGRADPADEGPETPRQRLVNGLVGLMVVSAFVAIVLVVMLCGTGWAVALVLFVTAALVGMTVRSAFSSLIQAVADAWHKLVDRP